MPTLTNDRFKTTEAYLSGGICGTMWMPAVVGGFPHKVSLRGHGGIMDAYSETVTFAEALDGELTRKGGDFQNAKFTADTEIVIIRRRILGNGRYELHTRTLDLARIAPDLVDADTYTSDVMGEDY